MKEDDEINGQLYYCISFLTPQQLENEENAKKFNVRGFLKIRGMFSNEESAKEHCIKLHKEILIIIYMLLKWVIG